MTILLANLFPPKRCLLAIVFSILLAHRLAASQSSTNLSHLFSVESTNVGSPLDPLHPFRYLHEANDYIKDGKYNEAILICSKVIKQLDCPFAYYLRGYAYCLNKDYDKAIMDLNEYGRTNASPSIFFLRGCAYFGKEDSTNALDDFNKANDLNPNDAATHYDRGCCLLAQNKFPQAIADFNRALEIDPADTSVYAKRAEAYLENGDIDNAISDCNKDIEFNTNDADIYLTAARAYIGKEAFDKSIENYNEVIRIRPHDADAYAYVGFLYSQIGEYKRAVSNCYESIRLDAKSALALNNLAWVLATCPDASIRDGRKALELARQACVIGAWTNSYEVGTLAAACAETGDFKEAIKWEKKSMELGLPAKELPKAQERLALYQQGKPYRTKPQKGVS